MTKDKKRSSVPVPKKIPANNKQGYKWRLVIEGPADPLTGERKQIPRVRDTQAEVKAACQAEYNRLSAGLDSKKAKTMTFAVGAKEWHDDYAVTSGYKGSTVEAHGDDISVFNGYFGNVIADKITHTQCQKIVNRMFTEKGLEPSTIARYCGTANMIFKWMIKENIIKVNPFDNIKMPRKQKTLAEVKNDNLLEKFFERDELDELLEVLHKHGLENDVEAFYFLLFSGVRPGELCALEWDDINFETNQIHIYKTIHFIRGGTYELTPPKTTGSVRKIYIDDDIIEMLRNLKERQKERHKRYKELYGDFQETNFVLTSENGSPFSDWKLRRRLTRLMKMTNIKKHATPHIFRHTHITMLMEASIASGSQIDLKTIMNRVGHDDEKTTFKIYTHVTKSMLHDNSEQMKIHFSSILKPPKTPKL